MIREAEYKDLEQLLTLYLHLHETKLPDSKNLFHIWNKIVNDENYHIIVCETDGKIVSSVTCVIIDNLTRNVRPYALIENVVTDLNHRNKGYATACMRFAKDIAVKNNCYKIMLLTGSENEATHNFYKSLGYASNIKTAYVQKLD